MKNIFGRKEKSKNQVKEENDLFDANEAEAVKAEKARRAEEQEISDYNSRLLKLYKFSFVFDQNKFPLPKDSYIIKYAALLEGREDAFIEWFVQTHIRTNPQAYQALIDVHREMLPCKGIHYFDNYLIDGEDSNGVFVQFA